VIYFILFDLAAILIIALFALGAAEYVPDAALVALMPLIVREPYTVSVLAWLLLLAVVALIRRWPPIAKRLLPWTMPAWLVPGAVKTVDTEAPVEPQYHARFMSSAKRVITDERRRELLTRRIRHAQETLHQNARTPNGGAPIGTPVQSSTISIDGEDARMAALLFGMGKSPAQVAKLLTGYSGNRNAEFVAKAEALKAQLEVGDA